MPGGKKQSISNSDIAKHLLLLISNKHELDNTDTTLPDNKLYIDNTHSIFDSEESIVNWISNLQKIKKSTTWITQEEFISNLKNEKVMCSYTCKRGVNENKICGAVLKYKNSKRLNELRCKEHFGREGKKLDIFIELQPIFDKINIEFYETKIDYSSLNKTKLTKMSKDALNQILKNIGIDSSSFKTKQEMITSILDYCSN